MDPLDELMDQRRHRRIPCQSNGRINIDGAWLSCQMIDLSGGGCSFRSGPQPALGTNVLVQIRGLGVIRASVARNWGQGFAVVFNAQDYDADALVDNLTLLANPGLLGAPRPAEAQKPQDTKPSQVAAESSRDGGDPEPPAGADAAVRESTGPQQGSSAEEADSKHATPGHALRAAHKALR